MNPESRYHHQLNQNELAIQSYKEALELRPNHWNARNALVQVMNGITFFIAFFFLLFLFSSPFFHFDSLLLSLFFLYT